MAEIAVVEFEDYETLPTHSLHVHLCAGALAGMMEHCTMYPIDSVKTRIQSLCPCPEKNCRTPVGGLIEIVRKEGIWRPIRGMNAIAGGAMPAHALYFTVYEKLKHWLTHGKSGHNNTLIYGFSGAIATIFHDAVMNPAEVVKQRMQMWGSPYKGSVQCARCIFKSEGMCAFYRSYATQLMMNIPFQSVHFMVYEFGQQILNPKHAYDPKSHLIAGALAGGIAGAITTPLDVVKTVLNTQQDPLASQPTAKCPATYGGFADATKSIYRLRGVIGFFSGIQARILFQIPATAVSWSVYEFFKYALSTPEEKEQQCDAISGTDYIRKTNSSIATPTLAASTPDSLTSSTNDHNFLASKSGDKLADISDKIVDKDWVLLDIAKEKL